MSGIDPIIPVAVGDEGRVSSVDRIPPMAGRRERQPRRQRRERPVPPPAPPEEGVTIDEDGRPHIDLLA